MSLPRLLLVDDSEAILAFESAALSGLYAITTSTRGRDALEKARNLRPDAVVLDLSMPEMDGDEVIERLRADADLATIPIVVVSSEHGRAEACLAKGASAFLPKPIRADELTALIARVLDEAKRRQRAGGLAVLVLEVGTLSFGLALDCVLHVLPMAATRPLPGGPPYLAELVELHGEPVAVLDLAMRLGVDHTEPLIERKLVVVAHAGNRVALCVDRVHDPEELSPGSLFAPERAGVAGFKPLGEALTAIATTRGGPLPIVDAAAVLSQRLLATLPALLRRATEPAGGAETTP